jgi:pyruvate formate lyase activating enzyme
MFEEIKKDSIFYKRSGGGVLLSGGEPLAQPQFATSIFGLCQGVYIHTALETCGHAEWGIFEEVLKSVDLLLYDFKHMDPVKHKRYTGVSNRLMLDNVRRGSHELPIPMWARIPVIQGYNDSAENIEATARFPSQHHYAAWRRASSPQLWDCLWTVGGQEDWFSLEPLLLVSVCCF